MTKVVAISQLPKDSLEVITTKNVVRMVQGKIEK